MSAPLPSVPSPLPEAPEAAEAAGLVLLRSLRSLARGRRLLAAGLMAALPAVLASVRGDLSLSDLVYILSLAHLGFLSPLVTLFLGTGLLYDEAEEGTLTFLFTSPASRRAVLLGKWGAALAAATVILLGSMGATIALSPVEREGLGPLLGSCFLAVFLGLAAYLGIFALLGTLFRRGFIAGILYCIAFEVIAPQVPGVIRYFSVGFHMQSLVVPFAPSAMDVSEYLSRDDVASRTTALATLLGVAVLGVAGALVLAGMREYQARNVQG